MKRSPQSVLGGLPHDLQQRVRREWWRRNRRSWTYWAGVLVLCASPFVGLRIGDALGVRRAPDPGARDTLINVATVGGTFLPGFALFAPTSGRIATHNLRTILRTHGFCPVCGHDLTGNASGVCPACERPVA